MIFINMVGVKASKEWKGIQDTKVAFQWLRYEGGHRPGGGADRTDLQLGPLPFLLLMLLYKRLNPLLVKLASGNSVVNNTAMSSYHKFTYIIVLQIV